MKLQIKIAFKVLSACVLVGILIYGFIAYKDKLFNSHDEIIIDSERHESNKFTLFEWVEISTSTITDRENAIKYKTFTDEGFPSLDKSYFSSIDPETYDVISYKNGDFLPSFAYLSDKSGIYIMDYLTDKLSYVRNADKNTFVVVGHGYAKDRNSVYYRGVILQGMSTSTLKVRDTNEQPWAHDGTYLLFGTTTIPQADPDTFGYIETNKDDRYFEHDYFKDSNQVYYRYSPDYENDRFNNRNTLPTIIQNADQKSFEIIKVPYAKDASNLFYRNTLIQGVDDTSFKILECNNNYAMDAKKVYFQGVVMENVEPESFGCASGPVSSAYNYDDLPYVKDAHRIFNGGKQVFENIDAGSFRVVKFGVVADKNGVYRDVNADVLWSTPTNTLWKKIDDADGLTFEYVGRQGDCGKYCESSYFKDKNYVFLGFTASTTIDVHSFEYIDSNVAKDNKYVYLSGRVLNNAIPSSFVRIPNSSYYKDAKSVWYGDKNIKTADPVTFEVIGLTDYAKDKNYVFWTNEVIPTADKETFEVVASEPADIGSNSYYISKDKNYVYRDNKIVVGANPSLCKKDGKCY